MKEKVKTLVHAIMSALSNCSLYSDKHFSVERFIKKSLEALEGIFQETDSIEFMIVEDELVVNKKPYRDEGLWIGKFLRKLKTRGITRLEILRGVKEAELKRFILFLARGEESPPDLPHIRAGVVEIVIEEAGIPVEAGEDTELASEQIEKLREISSGISPFRQLSTAGIEEIVTRFIVTMKREGAILRLLTPVKTYSEYTYTHAANVSVLSMFQAECLGFADEFVHDIGIAGLLHDVGKLFVSREVLEKKGRLTEKEFEEIKRHTIYGAIYLSKNASLPMVATITSLEHHRGYDGKGYPAFRISKSRQHLSSQIVQIADFFDALRSRRPYKRDWGVKETLALMKESSGKQFNPLLMESFERNIIRALKG